MTRAVLVNCGALPSAVDWCTLLTLDTHLLVLLSPAAASLLLLFPTVSAHVMLMSCSFPQQPTVTVQVTSYLDELIRKSNRSVCLYARWHTRQCHCMLTCARAALVHRAKLHDTGSEMTQAEVNNLKRQLHAAMKKKKRTQCPEYGSLVAPPTHPPTIAPPFHAQALALLAWTGSMCAYFGMNNCSCGDLSRCTVTLR